MRKSLLLLVFLALLPLSARAGKVVTDSLQSAVLGAPVKYNVYLPEGYPREGTTYPVVYLLHGLTNDYRSWTGLGNMRLVADELIGSGEACEMVIVMPNAGGEDAHHTWNGYFNMPGWNYEDFFFQEFMPAVEAKYHIAGDKGHRAVMGLSMGGGGSVVYCQRHPEAFSSCYAMSPWLDNAKDEVWPLDSPKDCLYYVANSVHDHSALTFVEGASDGTLEQLRTVAWFIDCGDDDYLLDQSLDLYRLMRGRGVKGELRVRNGVHNWEYWHLALRMALPFATRNFTH